MRLVLAVLLAVGATPIARAAGPLIVNGAGVPLVWTANPVPFNPDRGSLGAIDNATAVGMVANDFGVWASVPTASIAFGNAGALPVDVTAANYTAYLGQCGDGLSPIIFDTNGSITDDLFGAGASDEILGFAGPECITYSPPVITEGSAVLNGKFVDGIDTPSNPEISVADFNAVFVHEFGHYCNLDHSQINLLEAFDGDPTNDDTIATMFPILINPAAMSVPNLDDQVSLSMLYPAPSFASSYGTITGHVLRSDGTPFQGAYVIARKVDDPRITAVGMASGAFYFPGAPGGTPAPDLEGRYVIPGLPPGSYTVEIEQIDPIFTDGSSIGPLDPPATLPGPPEFWNGANEAATFPPDDPAEAVALAVGGGTTASGIDIVMNALVCPATPLTGCKRPVVPGSSALQLRKGTTPDRDSLKWKWQRGATTTTADLGNPLAGTGYQLCLYDETAGTPVTVLAASAPAGSLCGTRPCWRASSTGFTYADRYLTPDGISRIDLRAGAGGAARIGVKGKGAALGLALPLAQDPTVVLQLLNASGVCWEARFPTPAAANDPTRFKAIGD